MNICQWIEINLAPQCCTTDVLLYDDMESQSGYALPVIYQPFDRDNVFHWSERGAILDFLYSTRGEGGKLLDFGPGDGWPSLLVAPWAREVVGLDSSPRRVEVCAENARRLGIDNARFVKYEAGDPLPFVDQSFDGIMAASSVEQTPDPKFVLKEFYRVLRPGGRLRISYEGLAMYKDGRQQQMEILEVDRETSKLVVYNRDIERECAVQYGITLALSSQQLVEMLGKDAKISTLTQELLERLRPFVVRARMSRTRHPSGQTWTRWLEEVGFSQVLPTHSGGRAGAAMFRSLPPQQRPRDMAAVDEAIGPVVKLVVELACPVEMDPNITAVK